MSCGQKKRDGTAENQSEIQQMEIKKTEVLPISSKSLKWVRLIPSASALALEGRLQGRIWVSVAAAFQSRAGQVSVGGRDGGWSRGLAPGRAHGSREAGVSGVQNTRCDSRIKAAGEKHRSPCYWGAPANGEQWDGSCSLSGIF